MAVSKFSCQTNILSIFRLHVPSCYVRLTFYIILIIIHAVIAPSPGGSKSSSSETDTSPFNPSSSNHPQPPGFGKSIIPLIKDDRRKGGENDDEQNSSDDNSSSDVHVDSLSSTDTEEFVSSPKREYNGDALKRKIKFVGDNDFQEGIKNEELLLFPQEKEKCPPIPSSPSSDLCLVKRCTSDKECGADGSFACCYNGCIHSCLPRMNPPVAFDWVEDTEQIFFNGKENNVVNHENDLDSHGEAHGLLEMKKTPEGQTERTRGGCKLSKEQYQDLILFRKFDHVHKCVCQAGEVSCEVPREK